MWVRSQDSKTLVNCIFFDLYGRENFSIIGRIIGQQGNILLGEYKTEETALEVLDEIQEFIKYNDSTRGGSGVYNMPSE